MYLTQLYIRNNGPIEELELELPLQDGSQTPQPLVILGVNGSGKSTLLSIIVDSFYEFAANHFRDVTPGSALERPWFRIIGPWTRTVGASYQLSILAYQDGEEKFFFHERSGNLTLDVIENLPEQLRTAGVPVGNESEKALQAPSERVREVFSNCSLIYFPSSRSERPNWQNEAALSTDSEFDTSMPFERRLQRPIYVDRGLADLSQWMQSLLIDVRSDFVFELSEEPSEVRAVAVGAVQRVPDKLVWDSMNEILRIVLDDDSARFSYGHRRGALRLAFDTGEGRSLPLDALSAGQATLLSIFGTLVRYGDKTATGGLPANVVGVCVIDEIDAHIHVRQQRQALPRLMKLFPKVQFIASCHSPLFVVGLQAELGDDVVFLDMPSGVPIAAEDYSEFSAALESIAATSTFNNMLIERMATPQPEKLAVWCEGETDPKYLITAATVLGRAALLDKVDIEWVGAKNASGGGIFNTGVSGLNNAYQVFKAKPASLHRPLLLLFDNDTNKAAEDLGDLHVRAAPSNPSNEAVQNGIENLLRQEAILPSDYSTKEERKPNGTKVVTEQLKKVELCNRLCSDASGEDFEAFGPLLDLIEDVADAGTTSD